MPMYRVHELKIWPEHFDPILSGIKKVEVRSESDRNFNKDDLLLLKEWDPETEQYTSREILVQVTHCLRGQPFLPDGYVAMSISEKLLDLSTIYGNDCINGSCEF